MFKNIQYYKNLIVEAEKKREKLSLINLSYKMGDLDPVFSETQIKQHYDKLARNYVTRYNNNEGDDAFNEAGAYLHNIYFPQFKPVSGSNKPTGAVLTLIVDHFKSFENFQKEIEKTAMSIQGSGWVYLDKFGNIKTIKNHQIKSNIVLLIDWWEHAWFTDYGPDKAKYLKNIWRVIDWNVINSRLI
jgi:Fe-Mn family superoxide dismutase